MTNSKSIKHDSLLKKRNKTEKINKTLFYAFRLIARSIINFPAGIP